MTSENALTPFSDLLARIVPRNDSFAVSVTEDWRQGRTLYGGLSAALCVECAVRFLLDLPPLRSAQFSFLGPTAGELCFAPSVLRRGKTATFIAVDLFGESGLAVRATLCFGGSRSSQLKYVNCRPPEVPKPQFCESTLAYQSAYAFTKQFEYRLARPARPFSGCQVPILTQWVRHVDSVAPDSATALLALADVPPAAVAVLSEQLPVSTINWMVDILTDFPIGDNGWRLVEVRADTIVAGYSSQSLNIWSAGGKPLLASRQCVAVFA